MEIDIDDITVRIEGQDDEHDTPPVRRARVDHDDASERARAAREAAETQRYALQLERSIAGNKLAEFTARQESAQHDLRVAEENEDPDARATAYGRIAQLEAAKLDAQRRLDYLNNLPEPQISDPVERLASSLSPRSAAWVRKNSEWASDPRKSAKLAGAHHMAIGDGLTPDTDEYFAHVEKTLKIGGNGGGSNRGGGNMRGGSSDYDRNDVRTHVRDGGKAVYLTPGEIERSEDGSLIFNAGERDARGNVIGRGDPRIGKPIGRETFAYRKAQLAKQGYYDRLS
jgi:hypothetical protein